MIVYNVTVNVDSEIHEEWLIWMKNTHIPEVMNTGKFNTFNFLKIIDRQEDETGITYAIQYFSPDMETYESYILENAPRLREKAFQKFGLKFTSFRTLLQLI